MPQCETPKSPPGDYKSKSASARRSRPDLGVKHLNPRQGITSSLEPTPFPGPPRTCETPKSPPGDYKVGISAPPRQRTAWCETPKSPPGDYKRCVSGNACTRAITVWCETPKSPPGDYKVDLGALVDTLRDGAVCETPKSPPGDYKPRSQLRVPSHTRMVSCETPKSPPGDYKFFVHSLTSRAAVRRV